MKKIFESNQEGNQVSRNFLLIRFIIYIPYRKCLFSVQVNFAFGPLGNRVEEERDYLLTQEDSVYEKIYM